ncbi:MAG: spore coat associated protein CotJA [Tissierellia bacterium]|nr:spore coat associated protein CotJA [Tissierellia bacterium]NLV77215.1 spore coat associated protein CotJA [Tissierellia bacterium]
MNGDFYAERNQKGLARVYIPFQIMNGVFSPSEALKKGTLFPELYKPYKENGANLYGGEFNG